MDTCGAAYDSHAWEWRDARLTCSRCGLDDLAGRRVADHVLAGLRQAGYVVVRRPAVAG